MLDNLKQKAFFLKRDLLLRQGLSDGRIVFFDDDFYEKLSHTYVSTLPVSIHIKYLKPTNPPGKCYDRSLYMFFSINDAVLVRGNQKEFEYRFGKQNDGHGWIEVGNYVYDPSSLLRFDKDLYYKIYGVNNVSKCNIKEYLEISKSNEEMYKMIKNTTIDDFKPNGKKRYELSMSIPLVMGIAQKSNNQEFIGELNSYLDLINYDEKDINNELNDIFEKKVKQLSRNVK